MLLLTGFLTLLCLEDEFLKDLTFIAPAFRNLKFFYVLHKQYYNNGLFEEDIDMAPVLSFTSKMST